MLELVRRYVATKTGVTHNTEAGCKTVIRILEKNDSHFRNYYDVIFLLLKTGMRILEFVGLTIFDLDLK